MGNLGPTEIILILLVVVLLFGAKKLPELARGSGRALRIFKAETKGLMEDDQREDSATDPHGRPLGQIATTGPPPPAPVAGSHSVTPTAYPVDETGTPDSRV